MFPQELTFLHVQNGCFNLAEITGLNLDKV